MKIAVITSICGNREKLTNPVIVQPGVDYYAFVDQKNPEATAWKQLDPYHFSSDTRFAQRRNAKIYKVLPELFIPDYDFYIWADASHDLVATAYNVCTSFTNEEHPYAVFRHGQRNCIYAESEEIKKLNYDHIELVDSEMNYFRSRGYPDNNGLYELSAFIKRRTHSATNASLKWWDYLCRYSSRDQLSFPFVLWECGIVPTIMPGQANGYNSRGTIGNNPILPQTRIHVGSGG